MHLKTRVALSGLAVLAAVSAATPGTASAGTDTARRADTRCARDFDRAQRIDMESFRDYDLPTWTASHDVDAVTVLAGGQWFQGRDTIAAVLHRHFEDREAIWSWTELSRAVDGCRTGTILYEATYAIPSANFTQTAVVSVVYTRKHGNWLSVIDQSTLIPAS